MPRKKKTQPIISKSGGERIGSYLWWALSDIEISVTALKRRLKANGLDPAKHMPPAIEGSAAFRKAVEANKRGDRSLMVRYIKETPQELIYGVVRENVDEDKEDLKYKVKARIVFRKRTESVVIRGGRSKIADAVKDLYDDYVSTYIHTDIRRWVVRTIAEHMQAVQMKKNGGVYFIAHQHTKMLRSLEAVVNSLGTSEMMVTPIFDSEETTASVGRGTRGALERELAQIKQDLQDFRDKPPRRDTLKRRLDDFQQLKGRARMFADMLGFVVDDLEEGIDDADTVVTALIGQVEADMLKKAEARKAKRRKGYRKPARYIVKTDTDTDSNEGANDDDAAANG